ncbi:tyrosine-type recombinase/integrase [Pseudoduganella aquatica]|uniref:tyrosine-type recombinase/integrase n=1 Tax=Pseudoduganella aquatica TaxID=2660641 RepID=UPI001E3337F3|nr:site-specific integrase [Pseudoduganella aquatica]
MLTDTKLRNLKPAEKMYKVPDRDGLYVAVLPSGVVSFRYNYRINGRQETLVLGRYGADGLTLAEARSKLDTARKAVAEGESPARLKAQARNKLAGEETFGTWAERWLEKYRMAESTRDMRRSVYERDLKGPFGKLLLREITDHDLRTLCDRIVERGAPATAVHAREVVMLVFRHAEQRGDRHQNPADLVPPSSIAVFQPRDRALSSGEIALFYKYLDHVTCSPTLRIACKLLLLTLVRKSELTDAKWEEVNFSQALWTIPAKRMKRRNPHNVYLSRQALDMFVALKTCAGTSPFVLPSRYDPDIPMSHATLNRITMSLLDEAEKGGESLANFTPHDLRRTASTMLHEAGYNTDWIEKCLAHEQKGVRAVYNKAEYAEQRRVMLQDWADMVETWTRPGYQHDA